MGTSSRRTDDQLEAILAESDNWTIHGQAGQVLGSAASLAHALDRATRYAASGAVVVAICQQPHDRIIIFPDQIERLTANTVAPPAVSASHGHTSRTD